MVFKARRWTAYLKFINFKLSSCRKSQQTILPLMTTSKMIHFTHATYKHYMDRVWWHELTHFEHFSTSTLHHTHQCVRVCVCQSDGAISHANRNKTRLTSPIATSPTPPSGETPCVTKSTSPAIYSHANALWLHIHVNFE